MDRTGVSPPALPSTVLSWGSVPGWSAGAPKPQLAAVSMLPPVLVSLWSQLVGTQSPVLPAMIDEPALMLSASLVDTPLPSVLVPPELNAIVTRSSVVWFAGLLVSSIPAPWDALLKAIVESEMCSTLPASFPLPTESSAPASPLVTPDAK